MANTKERIISLIGKNIREIIQFEVKNPKIGFVTVTEVEVSADLGHAKVFVSFLGTKYPNKNLEELNKTKGFVRSCLAKRMDTWKVPDVNFVLDDTYDKMQRLDEILENENKVLNDMKK